VAGFFMRGAVGYLFLTTTTQTGGHPMADKADQALKLAQKLEKDLKALQDQLAKNDKSVREDINKALKELSESLTKLHNEQDKKYTDAHNQQAKEIDGVVAWAKQTFDTKGWF
jgi:chromosome segregation ATPase